ncbi:Succinate-semialdehyde dehydrogenase [NADP(+)] GabD [Delftia tsuruhatensis]|uniref:NAD-dependent succinate-semialdehyde dehydrogenase n=1 Tax=Delftia tsuruhatensis TaxID=180282 RepID=UPI001E70E6D2|nr:NAD-dependent succinate-semialdehyde dehydrogenase [Delftia tsuruhatensis]CAB5713704.1 Succinate-semialdehyde dehydrogenase [NADP(+)] GabD [Delftia tsuruhatensis]CAC9688712.1 Succinate-semialdehyde dehydrogenase [NADP(+)] GabD [Delftia tsuruhatensis]
MEYSQFIDGRFCSGTGEPVLEVISASTGQCLGRHAHASPGDVEQAMRCALRAFQSWRHSGATERSALLRAIAAEMRAGREAMARQITLELGKPLAEADKEVDVAAEMFEWAAEEARRLYGRVIPARSPGIRQIVQLEPRGVVAGFAGWNAPAITPARKISAALAAGCAIVLKPSEETAGVALLIARAMQRAGTPAGLVNMVFGDPAGIAQQLCAAEAIAMVTFTGATSVGRQLGAMAAAHMKKATLELGGHAPVIVWDDADLDRVAAATVAAKFRNAGQVCTSPTRFLVHESVYGAFCDRFVAHAARLRVGDPFEPSCQMGPLKNPRRRSAIAGLVANARDAGAGLLLGGQAIEGPGFFYEPTVLAVRDKRAEVSRLEPFGPVALMIPVRDADEALHEANSLPFGLAAYAFTEHMQLAHRFASEIDSGVVCINELQASLPETPFGGSKDSGLGSEGGIEGLREFLKVKCVRQGGLA